MADEADLTPVLATNACAFGNCGSRPANVVLMAKRCTWLPSCAKCPKRGIVTSCHPAGDNIRVVSTMRAREGIWLETIAALVPSPQRTALERSA